ncbi:WD repeat-containing protein 89 [Wyeomyia smithii]|uniref:WD repeat-containing protein 89 n=1 Tax=Wyeomyia smithii TaxID=174621 RepID=UPI0024681053|nr:WD repeat-containing protein 89 [Wyeomyia smithii]
MFDDPDSSEEESPFPDNDSCEINVLKQLFKTNNHKSYEISSSSSRACGLHLSLSNDSSSLAVGLSKKQVQIYHMSTNGELTLNNTHCSNSAVRGVRFFNENSNLFMTCWIDGTVTLFDSRVNKPVTTFEDCSEGAKKTTTSFDINQNDRVICASTDIQESGDSFLLFYDVRERAFLGSYWECHSEDITNVRFHPTNPDLLASSSVDGLVNVFDISQSCEDDALQYCFNVENSVETFSWHSSPTKKDWISCITTTNDFHLFDVENQDHEVMFSREQITSLIQRTSPIDCNVVAAHNDEPSGFFLLAGSNYNKGECLRTLKYDNECFSPHLNLQHNNQIVRASIYNEKEKYLITTGEGGLITVWRCEIHEETESSKATKRKSHITGYRKKPY